MHCGYFDTMRKGNPSSFTTPTVVGGRHPLRLKFSLKVTHPLRNTPTSRDFRLWRLNRKR